MFSDGTPLYNLAFEDYDIANDIIDDQSNSNNGDHYTVFYTVLGTIPKFFEYNPNSIMMVRGSDQLSKEFMERCKATCTKRCHEDVCKNTDRRINTYKGYVDRNFEKLSKNFIFYGGIKQPDGRIIAENYELKREYDSVFL